MEKSLENGPWSVMGSCLSLMRWDVNVAIQDICFTQGEDSSVPCEVEVEKGGFDKSVSRFESFSRDLGDDCCDRIKNKELSLGHSLGRSSKRSTGYGNSYFSDDGMEVLSSKVIETPSLNEDHNEGCKE
ncbi:hypothetical protein PTKIN_Ptkin06aG0076900 [Pterospermum kingtungense]